MAYRVTFTSRAERAFTSLYQAVRIRIAIALEKYADNPFHRHDVKKVKGCPPEKPRYRIRIGEYRATFRIIQDRMIICVVAVGRMKNFEY